MQSFFTAYLKNNPPQRTECYELKFTSSTSIPFKAVKDHQIENLLLAEDHNLSYKIIDPMFGQGAKFHLKRPFDCFSIHKAHSYVVVWFYEPYTQKIFYKIPVKEFLRMKETYDRKSLNEEMAREHGVAIEITKK